MVRLVNDHEAELLRVESLHPLAVCAPGHLRLNCADYNLRTAQVRVIDARCAHLNTDLQPGHALDRARCLRDQFFPVRQHQHATWRAADP